MSKTSPTLKLAVLIDADNTSADIARGLFEEIAKIGEASVRRIYGDVSSPQSRKWVSVLAEHAIMAVHQPAHTVGKNSADIALVIDAMDLMHSSRFDGFCLVSSDSDFTRLSSRIREQGLDVFGFGEQKTPLSFRQACKRFIYTEHLRAPAVEGTREVPKTRPPTQAVPLLKKAIALIDSDEDWVNLGEVGSRLAKLAPDFDSRNYGFAKLSDLVRNTNSFDVLQPPTGGTRVRVRNTQSVARSKQGNGGKKPAPQKQVLPIEG
ncbi:MAG: NYN domain-containing protein [Devosia sp.]|uniref:NYN domain-containing protein n=1 Tax=Devosia sp. TaxID=1871048 RepID=UPI0024C90C6F|nr:NYN domain-containing protein [Devosia sp.]UYN99451.1 MAG: NYN domain-containing protein [Devosia sp.]